MKVSFFHLGAAYAYIEPYLRSLGLDVIVPPFSSRRTLDLGTRFCPEMICAPCKLIFGNYVEALEAGADTLIMFGGQGTCRLGYSARQQERLLRQWGHSFTAHLFDLYHAHSDLIRLTRELAEPTLSQLVEALRFLFALITLSDKVEQATLRLRPRELERGIAAQLRSQALSQIASLSSRQELEERRQAILSPFEDALQDRERLVLRIGLIGDPYSISEPFFNLNLEQELGYLGVELDRWFWISRSLKLNPLLTLLGQDHGEAVRQASQPYLARDVGGFARSTVGEAVIFAQGGYDGLIHLAPFSCTPEIMADNIFLALKRDIHIPILSLSFDEQTSHTGLVTRLEAFVDLLWQRTRAKCDALLK
jgi:predicted nucleotide-binding protein (sugar kinase/HSP70/actin superfamily)